MQEVTEVRHDLENTRVEQPTVLGGWHTMQPSSLPWSRNRGVAMCVSALRMQSKNVVSGRTIARYYPSGAGRLCSRQVRISLSCGVFINQVSYRSNLVAMVTTNGIHIADAEPDGVERG